MGSINVFFTKHLMHAVYHLCTKLSNHSLVQIRYDGTSFFFYHFHVLQFISREV